MLKLCLDIGTTKIKAAVTIDGRLILSEYHGEKPNQVKASLKKVKFIES